MSNNNGNHRNLEHLINIRRYPSKRAALQAEFNNKRLARIEKAVATRPVYIPMTYKLDAISQTSPYQDETPDLSYDVIITGFIASDTSKDIVLRESYKDLSYVYTGEKRNLKLSVAEISGGTADAVNGVKGIFTLPSPIVIDSGKRLFIDIYKTLGTNDPEVFSLVLIGHRVFKNDALNAEQHKTIAECINRRTVPKTIILKQEIEFETAVAGGRARNVATPKVEEPLLLRGCRTSMSKSLISSIGIEGEAEWNTADCPVWAMAAMADDPQNAYYWFARPIFIDADNVVASAFENSIDGVNIDEQINPFTWIVETM